jgi:hypothetical protein
MILGFNHNVTYKGVLFHVQTEDSGMEKPHIITLLYHGGVIISSKKISYADIVKIDNLNGIIEELMKEQHTEMMRRLKGGEFDEKINSCTISLSLTQAGCPPESTVSPLENEAEAPLCPTIHSLSSATLQPAVPGDISPHSEAILQDDTAGELPTVDAALLSFFGPR